MSICRGIRFSANQINTLIGFLRQKLMESTLELSGERDDHLIKHLSIEEQQRIIQGFSAFLQIPAGLDLDKW